ncbi:thioesterase family protein [uncultured Mycolicibacterium sp.]|uniref:acyl-CoA thioesterase n=1 Tax=uncultured Mycolicibacterium sp. TaxID=2320817 RepID=UPI0026270116|nr:thioesterase family protein [uncultured Mycolicibacterium sp.]
MAVVLRHRVRYHETDQQGFLFNSRYLEIADVGLTEFVRSIGWPYPKLLAAGVDPSLAQATIDFRAPARFEDVLDVDVTCTRVGNSSFSLLTRITRDGAEIAEVNIVYVNVDVTNAKSRPLPTAVAEALRAGADHEDASTCSAAGET